jgi:hypothetical protein
VDPAVAGSSLRVGDEYEIAEELWVDVSTVRARLADLTPAEQRQLNERLDAAELAQPNYD